MATNVEEQQLQGLLCPMCLDVFRNPTLLSCGHIFCRGCLGAYDKQHRHDHIVCPVCRESTNLGEIRVAGLEPNFTTRDIQDKLHVVAPSQSFCPLHKNTQNNIFCEDCEDFICLICFIDSHKGHKIKKEEELEGDLRKKRDSLIRESETRKAQIEEFLNNAEQHIQSHFNNVEKEIQDAFTKGVTILQQKRESLLNDLDSIRKENGNQLEGCTANIRQAINDIKKSIVTLEGYTGKDVYSSAIKTQYLHCSELEKSLKMGIDQEPIVLLKQTAESIKFCPSDEKLLALGHIELGVQEISNIHQAACTNRKSEELTTRRKVAVIPVPVRSKALNIVRQVEAAEEIMGMAAQSKDAVVVGFVLYRPGSYRFSVSGENTQHLKSEVGGVYDIAFLTHGRSVVSHDSHTLRVYTTDRHSTGMQYTFKEGVYYTKLCVDQDDNIYAVNGNIEIYIFHGSNPDPKRGIPTGDIEPLQICVTKTGALITRSRDNSLDTLTVFDREGHVGSSITVGDGKECLYATVDGQDRVLVARVRNGSSVFKLTRYTLQGTTLIQQVTFNELKLPWDMEWTDNYLTSLAPKLIAFAHDNHVYFIELAE